MPKKYLSCFEVEEAVSHVGGGHSLDERLDGKDHAVHELKLFILRQSTYLIPHPLFVINAGTGTVENVQIIYRHFGII